MTIQFCLGHTFGQQRLCIYPLIVITQWYFSLIWSSSVCLESHEETEQTETKGESHFSVLPLPLSFARSRESKGCPNSGFDRGVGLRGSGRYPLKPSIFTSLLETKGYPEHTAQPATMSARSSRESHKCIFGLNNWFKNYDSLVLCSTQSCTYIFATMFLIETF